MKNNIKGVFIILPLLNYRTPYIFPSIFLFFQKILKFRGYPKFFNNNKKKKRRCRKECDGALKKVNQKQIYLSQLDLVSINIIVSHKILLFKASSLYICMSILLHSNKPNISFIKTKLAIFYRMEVTFFGVGTEYFQRVLLLFINVYLISSNEKTLRSYIFC